MSSVIQSITGTGIPVRGNDIDTDRIIPARFMKCVTFEGLGQYAFYDVRFDADGDPKDHPFNDERYSGSTILIVNKNFGCGSSREHAPQALQKFGVRAVIGESFAEIFAGNCNVMGIPAVTADADAIEKLMTSVEEEPQGDIEIDLDSQTVTSGDIQIAITMPPAERLALLNGTWDFTSVLLDNRASIEEIAQRIPYLNDFAPLGS
jgi:3-isopropylmalate/(R)-2-methylmalate dehydratase small subunit